MTLLSSVLFVSAALLAQTVSPTFSASDTPLEERFVVPPAQSRILPIKHILPDDEGAQDILLQDLLVKGFGGMVTNMNFDAYFESEAHSRAFFRSVDEAKKLGMALWLYDERGYPSGLAGGKTLENNPEWEARGLLIAQEETSGGMTEIACPPGTLVQAAAFPVKDNILDLAGACYGYYRGQAV